MLITRESDEHKGKHVFTLEFSDQDLKEAKFTEWEIRMLRLLVDQQAKELTVEGTLMILQMYASAITRGRAATIYACADNWPLTEPPHAR